MGPTIRSGGRAWVFAAAARGVCRAPERVECDGRAQAGFHGVWRRAAARAFDQMKSVIVADHRPGGGRL